MSQRKRKPKTPDNIAADARALGVTRSHLRLVLNGARVSDSLLQRWLKLDQDRRHPQTQSTP
jgi:S-adenosylmethionine:diacylglycerol 3-amino-3-carboxypropyl transferase